MRVVDSHLHLWDPQVLEYTWLDGPLAAVFSDEEIVDDALDDVEEDVAIFVQAETVAEQHLAEVRWVDSIALQSGVVAIVAGARLDRGADTEWHLDALRAHERVIGVRHLLQGEPDGFALSDPFLAGARSVASRGWTFDACVHASGISDVTALAAAVPELPIVLDHLGKPHVGTAATPQRPRAEWLRDMAELARHPQVFCKLSGLPAETGGRWTDAQVAPFLDAALESFGPQRLMWGSDWPVSAVAGEFVPGSRQAWLTTVAAWAAAREVDADALFWENALAFYGIR
ncbi:amidohydrolase family protein [Microbacterium sp.]|uniref:amidohydrolase family protein n=1 Tax=Microbacterium sp. TaxID=51671 RepID=UPI0028A6A60D|nr:amidohydrolase family protein [Microbacterium sp.]